MFPEITEKLSSDTNVKKYIFTSTDAVAETVLYKYPTYEERTVICCSTMSGCPVGCRFCGAGDHFVRNLTSEEIVEQVMYLLNHNNIRGRDIKKFQIMFMSMGEPLLNIKSLSAACGILHTFFPEAKLLVSTIGPTQYMSDQWTTFFGMSMTIPTIGLQFSIHESTDEKRNKLIPLPSKLSLRQISEMGKEWHQATGRRPFFNYCAHEDNSSPVDAQRLFDLFDPTIWECTISVVCERGESVACANKRQEQLASNFMNLMLEYGYNVRLFNPAGQDDIGGGCGQLWGTQQWMKDNPDKAKPSCGHGKPVVHAPQ